jgi:NAD(P)-dependent dehydrogenase (short-subunit alcohol dehydrogenase family)
MRLTMIVAAAALLLLLLLLLQTVAKEWGHVNVRCNAIAYGMIDTRLTRAKEGGEAISIAGQKVWRAPVAVLAANCTSAQWVAVAMVNRPLAANGVLPLLQKRCSACCQRQQCVTVPFNGTDCSVPHLLCYLAK